jgi:predicted peroxiredoxin
MKISFLDYLKRKLMEKIINKLINESTKGVDTYTHNGSTWLIFTESKQWVIELTEGKTLWYNFNFFKNLFAYASLEVVQNQHLITKWVEDNLMNAVKETSHNATMFQSMKVEDTLENGVKETRSEINITEGEVDDIIQDGVRQTDWGPEIIDLFVDDALENGVKETQFNWHENKSWVEGVIKDGVKETHPMENSINSEQWFISEQIVNNHIQTGIKETKISPTHTEYGDWLDGDERLDDIIQNGVKKTLSGLHIPGAEKDVNHIIKNGVKETKTTGNNDLFSTFQWMNENKTESIPEMIDDIINNGVKKTSHRRYLKTYNIDDTIQDGTEHDYWVMDGHDTPVDKVLDNGIKEIKPLPSQTGNKDWSEYSHGREDRTKPFNDYLNDTLEMGVKIK